MALPRITLDGVVVADPELRFSGAGKAWVTMRVVCKDRKRGASGEWEDGDTVFLNVKAFERLAENVAETFSKGDLVTITGTLKANDYEKDGNTVRSFEVVVDWNGAIGPDLRNAPWTKNSAQRSQTSPANDPWASTSPAVEEPPF